MVGGIGRPGTRAQEVDFNPTVGERQAEEFSPHFQQGLVESLVWRGRVSGGDR